MFEPNMDDFIEYLFVTGQLNNDFSIKEENDKEEEKPKVKVKEKK